MVVKILAGKVVVLFKRVELGLHPSDITEIGSTGTLAASLHCLLFWQNNMKWKSYNQHFFGNDEGLRNLLGSVGGYDTVGYKGRVSKGRFVNLESFEGTLSHLLQGSDMLVKLTSCSPN